MHRDVYNMYYIGLFPLLKKTASSVLTLVVGQQEGNPACKNKCWYGGGGDLTGALNVL